MRHTKKKMSRRRKTQKRRLYGRGNGNKPTAAPLTLRANAPEFVPGATAAPLTLRANAPPFVPGATSAPLNLRANAPPFVPGANAPLPDAVAIDCEMVGIGEPDNRGRYETTLAQVAIIDFNGNILLNKYVIPKEGLKAVTEYFTEISGINRETLTGLDHETHSFDIVKEEVKSILDGKIIVGHQLNSDFKVLEYIPSDPSKIWDTATIDKYMKNIYYINREGKEHTRGARKLKNITKNFVGNNIQQEGKSHSPVEDAISSMNLYRVSLNYPKLPLPSY